MGCDYNVQNFPTRVLGFMVLLIPDTLIYIPFFIFTVFLLHAVRIFSAYHANEHVGLQQNDRCIVQNVSLLHSSELTTYTYCKYKLVYSVFRKESMDEQDEEGPHSPMFIN